MSDSLKQLIRQYPELGDVFADFETRLLMLEGSLPNKIINGETYTESPDSTTLKEEPWSKEQWTIVNQLRGMVQFLYSKETERRANASKRRPIDTNKLNTIYKGIGDSNKKDD